MAKGGFNAANRKLDNAMKSKGLQKLRWYCQVCEKQCRDENGFKCHTQTEAHLRQMLVVGESAGKHISDYSSQFQSDFIALLSRRWGTKRVRINLVYQEFISDKTHLHMNATRWLSLTEFAKHLGKEGIAVVDETEKGWFVSWIDNSPRALARAQSNQKKERGDMDDEMRQRKLIQEQIERARREGERRRVEAAGGVWQGETDASRAAAAEGEGGQGEASGSGGEEGEGEAKGELKREEGEKVTLNFSFSLKPKVAAPASTDDATPLPTTEDGTKSPLPVTTEDATPEPTASTSAPIISSSGFVTLPSKTPAAPTAFAPKPSIFKSNPLKSSASSSNPLKKSNPLKGGSSSSSSSSKRKEAPMSAVEQIFQEEMARKNRSTNGNGGGGQYAGGLDKRQRYA